MINRILTLGTVGFCIAEKLSGSLQQKFLSFENASFLLSAFVSRKNQEKQFEKAQVVDWLKITLFFK